jgi:hypothetical protein
MLDAGCSMLDAGCSILDAGCWMLDVSNDALRPWSVSKWMGGERPGASLAMSDELIPNC